MEKVKFTIRDMKEKISNKYAAAIIIANRAKAIRENPADTDEELRKNKPTVIAVEEFFTDRIKYPEFNLEKINTGE